MFRPSDHDLELSEEEFRLLRDFVHERFGLFFEDGQRASFKTWLAGRLASLDLRSYEDYYHYLRFGPQRAEELARMISHLTNNETYFFREALRPLIDRTASDPSPEVRQAAASALRKLQPR